MKLPKYLDPARYRNALRQRRSLAVYDLEQARQERDELFKTLGLDPQAAQKRLNEALEAIGSAPYDEIAGTDSVHWLLFAAVSVSDESRRIQDILEIGTFRAKTSALLRHLFPTSRIVTCDLPETDPIMRASYRRSSQEELEEYLAVRDGRLKSGNIRFVEANSFFLPAIAPGPYDLIWIDGGHRFPEAAWDVCNAWHLSRPGGIVMTDDIIPDPRGGDAYGMDEGHRVLQYIAERSNADPVYMLKRLNPTWSADAVQRKYVAWMRKPAS